MAVTITEIAQGSLAEHSGIKTGDLLLTINESEICDVLDYRFYMTEEQLTIGLQRGDKPYEVQLKKEEYEDLGLEFSSYLMDKQRFCKNKCIFCFVDQTPKGMRETLYFKDDDARMSFLFGNYITLTNLEDRDIERIIKMHISPINVSVHTTNPDLRTQMMANPKAGSSLAYIKTLTDHGIKVNTQIVLCPGVNDGAELERTLSDLGAMYPNLQSIACVPVGLTAHRETLYPLSPYTKEQAQEVIKIINRFGDAMAEQHGLRIAYPADEFFLKAEQAIPDYEYYGDFDQLENGVGLLALLGEEFSDALAMANDSEKTRTVSIATGEAAYEFMNTLAKKAEAVYPNLKVLVYKIINDFFGHNITVAGLVTGTDLLAQLEGKALGEELLLPTVMLRHEQDLFLDDVSVEELSKALQIPVKILAIDGFDLLSAMLDIEELYAME